MYKYLIFDGQFTTAVVTFMITVVDLKLWDCSAADLYLGLAVKDRLKETKQTGIM